MLQVKDAKQRKMEFEIEIATSTIDELRAEIDQLNNNLTDQDRATKRLVKQCKDSLKEIDKFRSLAATDRAYALKMVEHCKFYHSAPDTPPKDFVSPGKTAPRPSISSNAPGLRSSALDARSKHFTLPKPPHLPPGGIMQSAAANDKSIAARASTAYSGPVGFAPFSTDAYAPHPYDSYNTPVAHGSNTAHAAVSGNPIISGVVPGSFRHFAVDYDGQISPARKMPATISLAEAQEQQRHKAAAFKQSRAQLPEHPERPPRSLRPSASAPAMKESKEDTDEEFEQPEMVEKKHFFGRFGKKNH
jgi:hypothetical protein